MGVPLVQGWAVGRPVAGWSDLDPDARRSIADAQARVEFGDNVLSLVRPAVVIPVGRHALAHLAPGRKVTEVHGTLIGERERRLVPWLHPAAALRNRDLRETLLQDARALPGILESAKRS